MRQNVEMAEIGFAWDPTADRETGGRGALSVFVDGQDLSLLVAEHEQPYADAEGHPDLAGSYAGLDPRRFEQSVSDHFLGYAGSDLACGPRDKTVLLGCTCGEPGCWPLMARIEANDAEVIWREFEQPHRRSRWSYEDFGPITFHRTQYDEALKALEANLSG
jgi:hypothetical protein